jgi:hypothetical protein
MPLKYDNWTKTFTGILCCASTPGGSLDVAIEFQSASGSSLEDLDHLIRRSTPVRHENWSNDPQIEFKQVYLATETSLWHTRYFGLRFLKPEYEIHVLLRDPNGFTNLGINPELYPRGALVDEPILSNKGRVDAREILVLNPLKAGHHKVVTLIRTNLSQNVALVFGSRTLQSGSPDLGQFWNVVAGIDKDQTLEDIWSNIRGPSLAESREDSEVVIDGVSILTRIGQATWWASASREFYIFFNPVLEKTWDISKYLRS